jgi:hypothetical protein
MKNIVILFFTFISLNSFSHCPMDFSEANLCAKLEWTNGPVLNQKSSFVINFWEKGDSSHTAVSPRDEISIYSWMIMESGHSHGGPALSWNEVSQGVFESKDARFFMGRMKGHWEVRVDLIENGNVVSRGIHKVTF